MGWGLQIQGAKSKVRAKAGHYRTPALDMSNHLRVVLLPFILGALNAPVL